MSEKKAYTPTEFAALFSRERTWTYRLIYAGKLETIKDYGRLMIPASEAERIAGDTGKGRKAIAEIKPEADPAVTAKGSAPWTSWVAKRKRRSKNAKGMTRSKQGD